VNNVVVVHLFEAEQDLARVVFEVGFLLDLPVAVLDLGLQVVCVFDELHEDDDLFFVFGVVIDIYKFLPRQRLLDGALLSGLK